MSALQNQYESASQKSLSTVAILVGLHNITTSVIKFTRNVLTSTESFCNKTLPSHFIQLSGDSLAHNVFAAVHTDLLRHHAGSDLVFQDVSVDTDGAVAESVQASTSLQSSLGHQWQDR